MNNTIYNQHELAYAMHLLREEKRREAAATARIEHVLSCRPKAGRP